MGSSISGFVFTGGQSTRFGSNKLLHLIDDKPMGIVVLNHLSGSIDGECSVVGPPVDHADFVSIARVSGRREGHGPLGAMCDVLENASSDFVVFAPCDTPYFLAEHFQCLVDKSDTHSIVVSADATSPHLRHWLLSCWHVATTRDHLISAYEAGERAIHKAVTGLPIIDQFFSALQLTNINTPSDAQ